MDEALTHVNGTRSAQAVGRVRQQDMFGTLREWCRIHGRRGAHLFHNAFAGSRMSGSVSFLCVATALGVAATLTTLYTPSYTVSVNGQELGVVADQAVVAQAVSAVERDGSAILGYDYQMEGEIDYDFTLTLKSAITEQSEIKTYFYQQLDQVTDSLRKFQVLVAGEPVGVVEDQDALNQMLDGIKAQYVNENTISQEFVQPVTVDYVYVADNLLSVTQVGDILQENTTGETTYAVQQGDTFNGIAYSNNMSGSDLEALNPEVNKNRLSIGQVLNVKEIIPRLSVQTVEDVTYLQAIPCPVVDQEDSTIYTGTTKIITQGTEGEAQINALVTYVNGGETQRDVKATTVLREATTTTRAVGTKERPKTASSGTYRWPISGRISSYFGGRYIFGSYSYHSGIDITANYGAAICAADGGTVTFSGYKGTYGKLIIITHDNGTQTYYAHNSSLLKSAGDKVYKGQQIAKAGSTGRSTGVHCHFEIRVGGSAVNPLSYLR